MSKTVQGDGITGARRAARAPVGVLLAAALTLGACQSTPTAPAPQPEPARPVERSLPPLASGDARTIYFELGSSDLTADHLQELDSFAKRLDPQPELRVHVMGYKAAAGEGSASRWLPEQRAKNVAAYLTSRGVALRRVTLQGGDEPIDATDQAGRAVMTVQ